MMEEKETERGDLLFELARDRATGDIASLSKAEQEEVADIRALLDLVDASWEASRERLDRVHDRFMAKLAERRPGHAWLAMGRVQTLGELIAAEGDGLSSLLTDSFTRIQEDPTPIEALLEPGDRTRLVGKALREAGVSGPAVGGFMLWLNRALANLVRAEGRGQVPAFARRQGGRHAAKRPVDE